MRPTNPEEPRSRRLLEVCPAPGLRIVESIQRAGRVIPRHLHGALSVTWVLSGLLEERVGGRTFSVAAGDLLFKPDGREHSARYGPDGARWLSVAMTPETARRHLDRRPLEPGLRNGGSRVLALRLYRWLREPAFDPLGCEELVWELCGRAAGRPVDGRGRAPGWLRRIYEQIEDDPTRSVTLGGFGEEFDRHPIYIARAFRRHFGCSIGELVRRRRIDRASELLVRSELPAAEIALACGFWDQSHFTRAFRRETGMAPARFRREMAGLGGAEAPRR